MEDLTGRTVLMITAAGVLVQACGGPQPTDRQDGQQGQRTL